MNWHYDSEKVRQTAEQAGIILILIFSINRLNSEERKDAYGARFFLSF
ncbi:hypothetical protein B4114_2812 [Geobacillus stearothermophilus]|uniref:Uncharacterized protein n=1 Tax=Geobacillus stearothermophilus TaxID=1422 RepID=A0A150N477_GEOSE|nr:hypothetical protein B4114_2812 [Geobacillus stearothermophilus]